MNSIEAELTIPPEILAVRDLNPSDKLLLALFAANPNTLNCRVGRSLGVCRSGLKKIKRRLLDGGFLHRIGEGWYVTVPGLDTRPKKEGGHFVSNSGTPEKENKVAPMRKVKTLKQIVEDYDRSLDETARRPGGCHIWELWYIAHTALEQIKSDVPEGPVKDKVVAIFVSYCDCYFAQMYVVDNLPREHHRRVFKLLHKATPEQLAKVRAAIEQAQLTGGKPTLLLGQLAGTDA